MNLNKNSVKSTFSNVIHIDFMKFLTLPIDVEFFVTSFDDAVLQISLIVDFICIYTSKLYNFEFEKYVFEVSPSISFQLNDPMSNFSKAENVYNSDLLLFSGKNFVKWFFSKKLISRNIYQVTFPNRLLFVYWPMKQRLKVIMTSIHNLHFNLWKCLQCDPTQNLLIQMAICQHILALPTRDYKCIGLELQPFKLANFDLGHTVSSFGSLYLKKIIKN